jgi:competence protein ComEA
VKEFLKRFFSFSKPEQLGLVTLILMVVVFWLVKYFIGFLNPPQEIDLKELNRLAEEIRTMPKPSKYSNYNKQNSSYSSKQSYSTTKNNYKQNKTEEALFYFDPNKLNEKGWRQLGLSEKQALSVLKFNSKGNSFKKKEDLKKVFVISNEFYKKVEPYIKIENSSQQQKNIQLEQNENELRATFDKKPTYFEKHKQKEFEPIELNSADTSVLKSLKGVGSFYALKILRYRQKLGGFIKKEQLLEIPEIDSVLYQSIKNNILLDSTLIDKIQINKVSSFRLSGHPYFSRNLALALINYRDRNGKYTTKNDLKKCLLVNDKVFNKIVPYLSFE